jgi:hypothetical protein
LLRLRRAGLRLLRRRDSEEKKGRRKEREPGDNRDTISCQARTSGTPERAQVNIHYNWNCLG